MITLVDHEPTQVFEPDLEGMDAEELRRRRHSRHTFGVTQTPTKPTKGHHVIYMGNLLEYLTPYYQRIACV